METLEFRHTLEKFKVGWPPCAPANGKGKDQASDKDKGEANVTDVHASTLLFCGSPPVMNEQ